MSFMSLTTPKQEYLQAIKRTLEKIAETSGKSFVRLSGEKPGWVIHELITKEEECAVAVAAQWPVYADGVVRAYASIDATPLYLLAIHRYITMTGNMAWLQSQLFAVKNAISAILRFGDNNRDGIVDYTVPVERTCGGLTIQNWMDSNEGWDEFIIFPIAPIEVQGYVWLAFHLWSNFFREHKQMIDLVERMERFARILKQNLWITFQTEDRHGPYLASNLNGKGMLKPGACSTMGHLLWTTENDEGVLGKLADYPERYRTVADRLLSEDMFDPEAGVRTFGSSAPNYDPTLYHCGAIWPHDNAIIALGMAQCGYLAYARRIVHAVFSALAHFGDPGIELYSHDKDGYHEHVHSGGNWGNREQAWTLAGTMAMGALEEKYGAP